MTPSTSRVAKTWMHRNMEKQMFDWPSQSPDLNPIENLFAWLKQKLGESVLELWRNLSQK